MIALDPPFSAQATVGGVVASNSSGPMRRGFGTARDLVIGMTFAMLDGKLVKTGGMVVKNVAGLDMGKLLIGSFGTLARNYQRQLSPSCSAARDRELSFHVRRSGVSHRRSGIRYSQVFCNRRLSISFHRPQPHGLDTLAICWLSAQAAVRL